jgi:glycosyltransferase involved in cell wall biosynthesis
MLISTSHRVAFEEWEPDTPDTRGIGGSETCQIELSWRLAKRGHEVISYAPVPWRGLREWRGTQWGHVSEVNYSRPGIWLLYRDPTELDHFPAEHPDQVLYFISQDERYHTWTPERMAKVDWFMPLCRAHAASILNWHPEFKDRIRIFSNGIKTDLIRQIEKEEIVRNRRKMIYASSPDRGLKALLQIFPRIREWVHDAELHVFYGFDNIDKLVAMNAAFGHFQQTKDELLKLAKQPGVIWRGRVNQADLIREWFSAGLWVHPSLFTETSCITCMEAQACGAIPVTTPVWAVGENVRHGIFLQGDPYNDPLVQARFVGETYKLMVSPDSQDEIRKEMMPEIRGRFNWERMVDMLEGWFYGFEKHAHGYQLTFQLKHATGKILNVGCASDPADLKSWGTGTVNLDVAAEDPIFHRATKADIFADVRDLPLNGDRYDTVVLGDILEHFDPLEVPDILRKCGQCLEPGGKIVITVPNDHRPDDQQHSGSDGKEMYLDNVHACHTHPVPRKMVEEWLRKAGFKSVVIEELDCDFYLGHGVVAVPQHPSPDVEVRAEAAHQNAYTVSAD